MIADVQRRVSIGLAIVLAVIIASGAASFWTTRKLDEDAGWVAHTDEVLEGLQELQTTVTDAETGQRGYLLTGDIGYLEPYDRASMVVPDKIDHIQELTADNPSQQGQMPRLRSLIAAKLAELKKTVDLSKGGNRPGALAAVRTDEGKRLMAEIRSLIGEMRQEEYDLLAVRKPANVRAYLIAALTGPAAAILGALSVGAYFWLLRRHILERERAAALLHAQRELLRATLISIGDAVIVTDEVGRVTMLNALAETLTGWSQTAAKGVLLTEVFHIVNETTRQTVENPALRALKEGIVVGLANHTVLIARDGSERPIDDSAAPVRTTDGALTGVVLVFRDITDRKRAERQLSELLAAESERSHRLRQVAAASLTLNTASSTSSVIDVVRAEAREIIGAEQSNVSIDGEEPAAGNGTLTAPLLGRSGRVIGHLLLTGKPSGSFTEDDAAILSQLANMAAVAIENSRLYDELRDANGRKDEFLATLAHELRNPLAPISNGLQVLKLAETDPILATQARAMMERQLNQMVRLVDDLLDVSRISRGKIELKRESVELSGIIRQVVDVCRPLADCAGQQMIVSVSDEPLRLYADPMRLAQVLNNLLTNACKYSESGGRVDVSAAREDDEALIRVTDNGIGIPPEMLNRVFEMFTQVDNSLEKSQGGLGIGLTLAKRLVELHGGTIEARSQGPKKGSEFIVRLPLAAQKLELSSTPDRGKREDHVSTRLRVLVVDDNRDSADSLSILLKLKGHEVATAHDGPSAVKAAETFRPELVLLDIGLPGMNGYDVAQRIRNDLRMTEVKLAALTGWGQEEDRRRSKEAGFDHHLVKPVASDALSHLLDEVGGPAARGIPRSR